MDLLQLPTIKALPDQVLGPDMEGFEGHYLLPVSQGPRPQGLAPDRDGHLLPCFPFTGFTNGTSSHPDLRRLGVKASGKQDKALLPEREPFPPLVNSTLPKQEMLPPTQQGITNRDPFLVSDALLHAPIHGSMGMMSK